MSNFAVLLLKEERALFFSPIAYVVMTGFLLVMGYIFSLSLFLSHESSFMHIFFQMFILFMLTAPIITMRLPPERKLRTLRGTVDRTAGVEIEVVLAKFIAGVTLVALHRALVRSYAVVLCPVRRSGPWTEYSGYLEVFFLLHDAGEH